MLRGSSEQVILNLTELNDASLAGRSVPNQLQFESLPLGASGAHVVKVRNTSPIELEFKWELRGAGLVPAAGDILGGAVRDDGGDAYEKGFYVTPKHGTLPPSVTKSFEVGFVPEVVGPSGATAVLVVQQVPPPSIPSFDQAAALAHLKAHGHGSWMKMQSWFTSLDDDGSGKLGGDEIRLALDSLGLKVNQSDPSLLIDSQRRFSSVDF